MNPILAMRLLIEVAQTENFRQTGRDLVVLATSINRTIARLHDRTIATPEKSLGTRLLTRTTRKVAFTEAGTRYLAGCRVIPKKLDHLESMQV